MAPFPWTSLDDLREKYTYDIHPFATFKASDRKGDHQQRQHKKNHHKHRERHLSPGSGGEEEHDRGGILQAKKRMSGILQHRDDGE